MKLFYSIILFSWTLFFILFFSSTSYVQATTYYVANSGNDACNGQSQTLGSSGSCAWKTISKINNTTFLPGDFISFNSGDTWREKINITSSGSNGSPISFNSYGTGAKPQIIGSDLLSSWDQNDIPGYSANLLTESFDASKPTNNGYDNSNYTEVIGVGSTIDSDSTNITDSAGGSTQILKIQKISPNFNAMTRKDVGTNNIIYMDYNVYVSAHGLTSTGDKINLGGIDNSSGNSCITAALQKTSDGSIKFYLSGSGMTRTSGADYFPTTGTSIDLNRWYKIGLKYDTTNNIYEFRVDDVVVGNGTLSSPNIPYRIKIGDSSNSKTITDYIDNIKVSNTGFPSNSIPLPSNVWKSVFAINPREVWFEKPNGTINWGIYENSINNINTNYEWFQSLGYMFIYSTTNPNTEFTAIEASARTGIEGNSHSYINISNFEIKYTNDYGINTNSGAVSNWIIDNNTIHHISYKNNDYADGIKVQSSDSTISNNTIYQAGGHGIYVIADSSSNIQNTIIEKNITYNNYHSQVDVMNLGGTLNNVTIKDNLFYVDSNFDFTYSPNGLYTSGTLGNLVTNINFYNNIGYNVAGSGIHVGNRSNTVGIYNNTIYKSHTNEAVDSSTCFDINADVLAVTIKNNIGIDCNNVILAVGDKTKISAINNNLWYNSSGGVFAWISPTNYTNFSTYKSNEGYDINGLNTDPLFVNASNNIFNLSKNSPLIDIGANLNSVFTTDFANTIRPLGGGFDIGAYEYIPLTVTVNQTVGQSDPTTNSPINFTVVFSESVSDFITGDVTLSGTAGATTATVTGSGTTYNVAVSGMTGSGTVIATILANKATGATSNTNEASTSTDNSVTFSAPNPPVLNSISIGDSSSFTNDVTPTITISSSNSPSDVAFSCNGGTNWSSWITYSNTISNFNITSGATGCNTTNGTKTITAKLKNISDEESSTANDNTYFDDTAPTTGSTNIRDGYYLINSVGITLNDGSDGGGSGINIGSRIVQRKSATLTNGTCGTYGSFGTITPSGSYPNMTDTTVVSGNCYQYQYYVSDNLGNQVLYSTSNTAKVDSVAPTVIINQAVGQTDPTTNTPIIFSVLFSESVSNFATGDVILSGTAGATTAIVTGSGTTYTVNVSGMTGSGTVIASINAGVASDAAGNNNEASTSTDNSVTWNIAPPTLTSISIGDSAGFTNDSTPTINIVSSGSPTYIAFSCETGLGYSNWIPYADTITTFNITSGAIGCTTDNEIKTITAKLKNIENTESAEASDSTYYDTTAPSGGSIDIRDGNYLINSVGITLTDGSDGSGSGINTSSRIVQRKSATLTNGTCGTYGSFGTITPSGTYPNMTDSTVTSGNCYQYQYYVSDNLGNQVTYNSSNSVKVDISGPTIPGIPVSTPTSPTNQLTQVWTWTASTDSASGVANYLYRTTGTSVVSGSTNVNSIGTSLTEGTYTFYVKAIDNFGNTGIESQANMVIDTTLPTVTINQSVGQTDPTNNSPINFTVVFSKTVTGFTGGDITLSGSANPTTAVVTGVGATYNVAVSGMSVSGTVNVAINAGVAVDTAGNSNEASTSTDNSVTWSIIPPSLTSISIGDSAGFTNDVTPIISVEYSGSPTHIAFSCNGGTNWSSWIVYADNISSFDITSGSTGCDTANGIKTITAKLKNVTNDESSNVSDSTYFDNTAPISGTIDYQDGDYSQLSVGITLTDGSDGGGSGVNTGSRIVQRKSATLTNGTCGIYGSFNTISPTGTYPNLVDSTVLSGNCYQYQFLLSDNLGNIATYTSSNTAKVKLTTHSLNYSADTNGTIVGNTSQTVEIGSSGSEVSAVGNTGFMFLKWNDNSTDNPRQDVGVNNDINVMAEFIDSRTMTNPTSSNWQDEVNANFISIGTTSSTNTNSFVFNIDYYLNVGSGLIHFPNDTIVTKTGGGNFDMTKIETSDNMLLVQNILNKTIAIVKIGITNVDLTFSELVTISIPVGNNYNGQTLTTYFQNETSNQWNLGVSCIINSGSCTFLTNHATTYAVVENEIFQNQTNSSSSNTNSNNNETPTCNNPKPPSKPDLFQINTNNTTAKIFFTPIPDTNRYYISFSTKPNAKEHGADVTLAKEGVQNFTIGYLKPNTTYYIKVRGQNGCMPGDWSNIMKITTRSKNTKKIISFYRYSVIKRIIQKIWKK